MTSGQQGTSVPKTEVGGTLPWASAMMLTTRFCAAYTRVNSLVPVTESGAELWTGSGCSILSGTCGDLLIPQSSVPANMSDTLICLGSSGTGASSPKDWPLSGIDLRLGDRSHGEGCQDSDEPCSLWGGRQPIGGFPLNAGTLPFALSV